MFGSWSLLLAFLAGVASFLSPCVLPLLPGYLSFLTGLSTVELAEGERRPSAIIVPALMFVVGFSIVFIGLGATASILGQLLSQYRLVLERVGGVAVVLLGVLLLGVIKVPWLYGEARLDLAQARRFGGAAAVVMGMAFAFGWTPCVGPILAAVLTLAAGSESVARGALLLLVYSAGLGVPFVLVAVLFARVRPLLAWLNRHSIVINRVAGIVLIVVGVLIATGRLGVLAGYLARVIPHVNI